jgi:hypothetical protein
MMSHDERERPARASRPVTMERLEAILDAYGAAPRRWPEDECYGVQRLLDSSAEARRRLEDAARLDELLDAVPLERPRAALEQRILAAAPRPRASQRWRLAALAAPLAAAAAVLLWISARRPATPDGGASLAQRGAPAVSTSAASVAQASRREAAAAELALGDVEAPTDALLGSFTVDVSSALPAVGCSGSTLGCPKVEGATDPLSERRNGRRSLA